MLSTKKRVPLPLPLRLLWVTAPQGLTARYEHHNDNMQHVVAVCVLMSFPIHFNIPCSMC